MLRFCIFALAAISMVVFEVQAYDAAVLFALREDRDYLVQQAGVGPQTFHSGRVAIFPLTTSGGRFCIGSTRAGLLETMHAADVCFAKFNARRLISFGLAGALSDAHHPGDIVIVRHVGRHDQGIRNKEGGFQPSSTELKDVETDDFLNGLLANFIKFSREADLTIQEDGVLVSGDAFVESDLYRRQLALSFKANLVDMNSAALLEASESFQRPLLLIRVVTDQANDSASADFQGFISDRSRVFEPAVTALLKALREMGP